MLNFYKNNRKRFTGFLLFKQAIIGKSDRESEAEQMNKNDVLLVAKNKSLYFFPSIRSLDVWSGKDLLQSEFIKSARQQLANYQLIVFLDYGFDMEMARRVRPFTNAKIVLFFWNHFKAEHEAMLKQAQDEPAIDEIYHFDFLEAKELGLKHNRRIFFLVQQITAEKNGQKNISRNLQKEVLRPITLFFRFEEMNNLDTLLMKSI